MCTQLSAAFVLDLMIQSALGVVHMHSCGILHRDLKADNALIQSLDPLCVKWGDYGCAVQLGRNQYGGGTFYPSSGPVFPTLASSLDPG